MGKGGPLVGYADLDIAKRLPGGMEQRVAGKFKGVGRRGEREREKEGISHTGYFLISTRIAIWFPGRSCPCHSSAILVRVGKDF